MQQLHVFNTITVFYYLFVYLGFFHVLSYPSIIYHFICTMSNVSITLTCYFYINLGLRKFNWISLCYLKMFDHFKWLLQFLNSGSHGGVWDGTDGL